MSVVLTINGQTYDYPTTGDEDWGPEATDWAVAVSTGLLQKSGGLFQLLNEVDFGSAFGIKALYYKSRTTNVASSGNVRLAVSDTIQFRNNANDANLPLAINGSDQLTFDGIPLAMSTVTVTDTDSIDLTLAGNDLSADLNISSDAADPSTTLIDLSIEADGLKAQVANTAIIAAIPNASASVTGLLTNTDWSTFNNKQSTISISAASPAAGNINAIVTLITNVLRTQVPILIGDSGSGGTAGVVPAPASGDAAAGKFLSADATWKATGSSLRTINAQTGTTYTFALSDGSGFGTNPLVTLSNSATVVATVPPNGTIAFPVGSQIDVIRGGAGEVQIVPGGGVTINAPNGADRIAAQYAAASLLKTATNTWDLFGDVSGYISATGGTITTDGNFKVHTFTSSGSFQILAGSGTVESLVIGGGGAGGALYGGGGGAGRVIYTTPGLTYGVNTYSITVGAGGTGTSGTGGTGGSSVFDVITSTGGGGGGDNALTGTNGASGDGGGGGGSNVGGTGTGGFNGGTGNASGSNSGGGGGGASAVGSNATTSVAGVGGAGVANSITGSSVTYGGGGGGGSAGTPGTGGSGGGGNGATSGAGTAGTANSGSGGGGSGSPSTTGAAGGSGVVILRYRFQ